MPLVLDPLAAFHSEFLAMAPHRREAVMLALAQKGLPQPKAEIQGSDNGGRPPALYRLTPEGVALIPVVGILTSRPAWYDDWFGFLSYPVIARRFLAAMADPAVKAVLLEYDTPGGLVAGCSELAARMLAMRGTKPVWAVASASAFSAGYFLASSADRVLVPPGGGGVGSIGVMWQHMDLSGWDQAAGLKYTVITSGKRKNDFNEHFTPQDEALAWAQSEVDRLAAIFEAHVAKARGLEPKAVADQEAGLFFGPAAVAAKLADGVADWEEALAALTRQITKGGVAGTVSAETQTNELEDDSMPDENRSPEAQAGGGQPEAAAGGDPKARIKAILDHPEAEGRQTQARVLALETDLDVEAAAKLLSTMPKAEGKTKDEGDGNADYLAGLMQRVGNPEVGSDAGEGDPDAAAAKAMRASMDKVVAARFGTPLDRR